MSDPSKPHPGQAEPVPHSQPSLDLDRTRSGDSTVSGVIDRITYHDDESGFSVIRVRVSGRASPITVVGQAIRLSDGEWIDAEGKWQNDRRHGMQFKADRLRVSAPVTRKGIERFLSSGIVRGIGAGMAKRLVAAFDKNVFDIIENQPERLREVSGIGAQRSARIVKAWREQSKVREVMTFLHSHGIGTNRAMRIHKNYGERAIELIRSDPYRLARDIRGIGFSIADQLAQELGIEKSAATRIRAGLHHVLTEATKAGHCGLPEREILENTGRLLAVKSQPISEAISAALAAGEIKRSIVEDIPCLFLANLYRAERAAGEWLLALAKGAPPWRAIDPERALPWVERELGIEFAPSQQAAITRALSAKLLVLTGGPGVGKTTLVNAILHILKNRKLTILLAAPTGRAAKRLSDATGMEAMTIHRLLEAEPHTGGFKRGQRNPLVCDLLVVDETSMVDVLLLHSLLRALPASAALLLVGDVDQLPSVGPGQVLRDMIDAGTIETVRLLEVFRQADSSRIVRSAHAVNLGKLPELTATDESDFYFVEARDSEDGAQKIMKMVRDRIPSRFGLDPLREIQILCPMHGGRLGTRRLNEDLQRLLNPNRDERIERFGSAFAVGDKIMQTSNNYDKDTYNGDIGFVSSIDREEQTLSVLFEERIVEYSFDELDQLLLAYAITVHKSQGSEYPAIIIPWMTEHYMMLKRNLLYTGITRGKQLVVVVGQRRALEIAVADSEASRRWTKLGSWLRGGESASAGP